MSYVGTGSGNTQTADERRAEADRILKILDNCLDEVMNHNELLFLADMSDGGEVTPKQL
jgi:hypothetical protein